MLTGDDDEKLEQDWIVMGRPVPLLPQDGKGI